MEFVHTILLCFWLNVHIDKNLKTWSNKKQTPQVSHWKQLNKTQARLLLLFMHICNSRCVCVYIYNLSNLKLFICIVELPWLFEEKRTFSLHASTCMIDLKVTQSNFTYLMFFFAAAFDQ